MLLHICHQEAIVSWPFWMMASRQRRQCGSERSTEPEPLQILLLRQSLLMAMIHLHMHLRGTKNSFEASSQYWRSNRGNKIYFLPFWSRGSEDSEEGKSQSLSVSAARIIGTGFVTCWTNGIAYSKFTEAIQATLKFHWKQVGAKSDPTWVLHDSCWQCHQQSTFSHEYCGGNSNVRQSLPQCYVKRPWFHKPSRLASLLHSLLMHLTDRDGWGGKRALLAGMRVLVLLKEHDVCVDMLVAAGSHGWTRWCGQTVWCAHGFLHFVRECTA